MKKKKKELHKYDIYDAGLVLIGLTVLTHWSCVASRTAAGEDTTTVETSSVMTTGVAAAHVYLCQHTTMSLTH